MTEQQFKNRKWVAFELMIYQPSEKHQELECVVTAVNFDDSLLELRKLIPSEANRWDDNFMARYEWCKSPRMIRSK